MTTAAEPVLPENGVSWTTCSSVPYKNDRDVLQQAITDTVCEAERLAAKEVGFQLQAIITGEYFSAINQALDAADLK